jgi:hypothetical protein
MPNPPLTSWTPNILNDVLMDTGILYIGASAFAAQDGGVKYDPMVTLRQIPFDGSRAPIVGLDRVVEYKPKITGNVIELERTNLLQLHPGASAVTIAGGPAGASQYWPKRAGVNYLVGDYLTNVRLIWLRTDNTYFQVRFPKAIVVKWDIAAQDKQEGKIAIELEARLDMAPSGALPSDPPMVYEYSAALT